MKQKTPVFSRYGRSLPDATLLSVTIITTGFVLGLKHVYIFSIKYADRAGK